MRSPGLSFALLLTIAPGIGSNTAIYGFLQGMTHPASPLKDSAGIVSIFMQDRSRGSGPLSPDDYRLLQNIRGPFEWIGAVRIKPADTVIDGGSRIATVAAATPNLAQLLAVPPCNGAVISHRIAQSEFGGNIAAGSSIRIDGKDFKIDGVAPGRLYGLYSDQSVDLWIQLEERDLQGGNSYKRHLWVLARLRNGVKLRQAQAALLSASPRLRELTVTPFTGIAPSTARGLARVGVFLSLSAAAVFFIACINVALLLLGRALRRTHETSVRIALGATRDELLRELFADSIVISIAGGSMGVLLGVLTARTLPALLFEEDAARLSFAPHLFPILAVSLVCIVITALCGMMPVLGTVTDRPWTVLQRETGSPSKTIQRLRSGLVVCQITACCMLVLCSALLLAGLHSALETSAGHRLGNPILLTVQAQVRPDGPEVDPNYFAAIAQKVKSAPGLSPLAWTARLPGNQPTWRTFTIQPSSQQYRKVAMDIAWLTPDSLQSLDSQPVAGRMFGLNEQGRTVAVVNVEAAAELFGSQSPGVVMRDDAGRPIEIIGVVKRKSIDVKQQSRPTIYYGYVDQSSAPIPIRNAKFRVPVTPPVPGVELNANVVSPNYFGALDMQLIAGQMFPERRNPRQEDVAVINQEAADLYFNGRPLGAGIIDEYGVRSEIIGVFRSQAFGAFEQHAEPTVYFPMSRECPPRMTLILKYSKWNRIIAADLLHRVESVPGRAASPVVIKTLDTQLAQSGLAALRIATLIGGALAAIALVLSIFGLLSAQGDAERQRQHDRALRIALGAQRWRIVCLVVINAARLALVGTAIGALLSFALSRLLVADIPAVASPPLQMWLVSLLLPSAAIVIASIVPARRASGISPLAIMRED